MNGITKTIIAAIAVAALFGGSTAFAQRNYDTKTVETIEGTISSIEKTMSPKGRGRGMHLMLKTGNETISVHVGPTWYIDKQTVRLQTNDTITVTGSRITVEGAPAIIASRITKGSELLKLRDDDGVPMWSRGR